MAYTVVNMCTICGSSYSGGDSSGPRAPRASHAAVAWCGRGLLVMGGEEAGTGMGPRAAASGGASQQALWLMYDWEESEAAGSDLATRSRCGLRVAGCGLRVEG